MAHESRQCTRALTRRTVLKAGTLSTLALAVSGCADEASSEDDDDASAGARSESVADLFDPLRRPTQLTTRVETTGEVFLSWAAGSVAAGELAYIVRVDGVDVATVSGISTTVSVDDPGDDHRFDVRTVDSNGVSSEPTATVLRTAEATTSGVALVLVAEPAVRAVQFRWTRDDGSGADLPAEYRLFRRGDTRPLAVFAADPSRGAAPATDYLLTAATPYVEAEYVLRAYDGNRVDIGEARNRVLVTPRDRTWPVVPTRVSPPEQVAVDANSTVSWSIDEPDVIGVNVSVDGTFVTAVRGPITSVDVVGGDVDSTVQIAAVHVSGAISAATAPMTLPRTGAAQSDSVDRPGFTTDGAVILGPTGSPFVPIGANVSGMDFFWNEKVLGRAESAADEWRWNCVRVGCGMSDWGAVSGGYLYFRNNDLRRLVDEYTGRGIVVVLTQFSSGPDDANGRSGALDSPGGAPDGSGRSIEAALTDWWVHVATMFADNPLVWINPLNEPEGDLDALDRMYRRMMSRLRAVAPRTPIVLDAAYFANDIPNDATIGTGSIDPEQSFVLSRGPSLVADFGEERGFGPIVFSVHVYSRWPVNYGDRGRVTDRQLADRMRAFARDAAVRGVPFLVGETGVEDWAQEYDSASVRVGLYEQGTTRGRPTGVWQELGIGVLAWHTSPSSGMPLAADGEDWASVKDGADASPPPDAGVGLWNYSHSS
ncbi:cellulase family glycosylhydrolase [Rhodococcus sp. BP-349]|uniref:cellulase family glycosylhydrolase n=1 Tax=unclassified Rhodococcus (in: high G+C Gram-positive bacteria) TaxID=192944 RepID=UPI001C9AADD3|nr:MULTISPECIES: cellulase family glycosylhydrolase [unclassified Rhodococcus (in: high G+C Gram-positive bacteria)]MBY6539464.1 cellulase family glycosylhydrolase [Rhodococcus sp. BP-363]MBY6544208.1 cellulase family glycosylhydrolase [Rhodococcus sp. BP-369]MBY6563438.1 cellulase family glycosylhydrolase [Rhodococcus sp. BP-370]MBY6577730.1 cellulase family glycosylhydrolase [Rhodococcus sp. BP-364]MBY6587031.1 cellulase family glycosylhydrolase [Rhodococcus sp. BP-358]